jgi:hypothetical protein
VTYETYVHITDGNDEEWTLVPDSAPICRGGFDAGRSKYVAQHVDSGRVIATHDTHYGLLAKVARFYLRKEG